MNTDLLKTELVYRTSRSGGKGGQNVNKVETKVEVRLDIAASAALTEAEKKLILEKLAHRISAEGILALTNQTARSQWANKQLAESRLIALLQKSLHVPKKRRPTAISKEARAARVEAKRKHAEKKAGRRLIAGNSTDE